jgi:hypothetical protein
MHRGLLLLWSGEPPYRYDKFSTLLQSQQTHIQLGLYLRVTSSLVVHRSYWAPGPDEYLWYRQLPLDALSSERRVGAAIQCSRALV